MCCSPLHYPNLTGAWKCDAEAAHIHAEGSELVGRASACTGHDCTHIVLPERVGFVCVHTEQQHLRIQWHRGAMNRVTGHAPTFGRFAFDLSPADPFDYRAFGDLVAQGISEGGHVSHEWLRTMLERESGGEITPRFMTGSLILDAPRDLTYAEWLVRQAEVELKAKNGELAQLRRGS